VILKVLPKAGEVYLKNIDQKQRSKKGNLPIAEKESRNTNSDAAFGTVYSVSRIVGVFKEASRNFISKFSL
jgi:hypothetical protein